MSSFELQLFDSLALRFTI